MGNNNKKKKRSSSSSTNNRGETTASKTKPPPTKKGKNDDDDDDGTTLKVALAQKWDENKIDVTGWYMSEKLDGKMYPLLYVWFVQLFFPLSISLTKCSTFPKLPTGYYSLSKNYY